MILTPHGHFASSFNDQELWGQSAHNRPLEATTVVPGGCECPMNLWKLVMTDVHNQVAATVVAGICADGHEATFGADGELYRAADGFEFVVRISPQQ
jgi:hypothetical protein